MKPAPSSYLDFLDGLRNGRPAAPATAAAFQSVRDRLSRPAPGGHPFLQARFAPAFYLVDYAQRRYLYVDEACFDIFGLRAKEFIEEGLEGYLSKWHPADLEVNSRQIFPSFLTFLQTVLPANWPDYVFSFNYRVRNARGEYITVLQRSSFLPDTDGLPAGAAGLATDITHFRSGTEMVATIEHVRTVEGRPTPELLHRAVYQPAADGVRPAAVSPSELPVLRLLAKGYSSKQIADTLHLSVHTVHNHRKNMLHRTGCHSSAELVSRALREGWLA